MDSRLVDKHGEKLHLAASFAVFDFAANVGRVGNSDLDGDCGRWVDIRPFFVEEFTALPCHVVEPCADNAHHTLCLELGFCPAPAALDVFICEGGLEIENIFTGFICHRMVWHGTGANASGESELIFLVGATVVCWYAGFGSVFLARPCKGAGRESVSVIFFSSKKNAFL